MTAQGYNDRTDSFVWTCDGPPLLARGMVAAGGTRCGRRLELPNRVLAVVQESYPWLEPWEVVKIATKSEWQALSAFGDGELAGRILCPDHRLAWDDEPDGRPIKATLDEQLRSSLEDIVAAAYARLGLTR